ncbi:MAG: hypothetical protein HWN69_03140 [Desulfobacterales bacterium]|nr:hypothetical protein [Desulfobacterales bacterium]
MKNKAIFVIIISCLCMAMQSQISGTFAEKAKEEPEPYYVGMEKCKECHPGDVKTYSEWKYSRNFRILEMRGKEHDPQCVPCHTTGYGKPGGFVSVEETPHMKNVQCEACHGPASLHVKAPTIEEHQRTLSIPRNVCTTCHHQHEHVGY